MRIRLGAVRKHARQAERGKGQDIVEQRAVRGDYVRFLQQLQHGIRHRHHEAFAEPEVVAVHEQGERGGRGNRAAVGERVNGNERQGIRGGQTNRAVGQVARGPLEGFALAFSQPSDEREDRGRHGQYDEEQDDDLPRLGGDARPIVFAEHKTPSIIS